MLTRLAIKVVPGASQDRIAGWLGEALKIRVRAQPEKGKANAAVIALLAAALGVPAKNLRICSGHTSSAKMVEIEGISEIDLHAKIALLTADSV